MTKMFSEVDRGSAVAFNALGKWHKEHIDSNTVAWHTDPGELLDESADTYAYQTKMQAIHSAQVDTGANATLLFTDKEKYMSDSKQSSLSIQVADENTRMHGSKDGRLRIIALGPIKPAPELNPEVTTVQNCIGSYSQSTNITSTDSISY